MLVGLRGRLRLAGLCLLGVVACSTISTPVLAAPSTARPAPPVSMAASLQPGVPTSWSLASPARSFHDSAAPRLCAELRDPAKSIAPLSDKRAFLEDTAPLSGGPLKAGRLRAPRNTAAWQRAGSPMLRNRAESTSNRQRAP
jgi:hypothetical protein